MICAALAAAVGCSSSTGSATGADAGAPAAKLSEIYPLIFPANTNAKCNFCHSMPASNVSNGNLSMGADRATAYAALVGKTASGVKCVGMPLVVAGQPEMSLLLQKVSSDTPPCGSRMPLGASGLTDAQIEMIRSWIAAGANDD